MPLIDENTTAGNPRAQANEGKLLPISGYNYDDDEAYPSTIIAQSSTSASAHDQTLLKALQDLIICVMEPKQTNDVNQKQLGLEAQNLITALRAFISSIVVYSQSTGNVPDTIIKVNLVEEDNDRRRNDLEDEFLSSESYLSGGDKSAHEEKKELQMDDLEENERQEDEYDFSDGEEKVGVLLEGPSSESGSDESAGNNAMQPPALQEPQSTFEEKLLRALRDHVFNKMPIRLLFFEPREESDFIITLVERGTIYARIASALQRKMQEEEFRPQKTWISGMETDEEIIERLISKYARYGILSHTWLRTASGELTYGDWNNGPLDDNTKDSGYRKLVNFCKAAWKDHELTFGWMDTICINKESSSELDESIRSMYNWYRRAAVCITYLAETETLANMHLDSWFTRGWTLQELLAPRVIRFYNRHWERFVGLSDNDKAEVGIRKQIERATTISRNELYYIHGAPISRRMQLAASREVTREEDTAYSLMGLFNVSISTAYGEGSHRAFSRLLQEILLSSRRVLDILNWAGDLPSSRPYTSRILPSSPKHYVNRSSNHSLDLGAPAEPLTLTHLGLRVPVVLMPGIWNRVRTSRYDPIGNYNATVNISPVGWYNDIPTSYDLLDNRIAGPDGWKSSDIYQLTFAVFNFTTDRNFTSIRKTCIAIGLRCKEAAGEMSNAKRIGIIRTNEPIVFELSKKNSVDGNFGDLDKKFEDLWSIRTDKLEKHGMQLINLYL